MALSTRGLVAAAVAVPLLLFPGPTPQAEEGPYPIWWSPSLELESLDKVDKRLARKLWPDEGYRIFVGIGKNRKTEIAHSCADIRRLEQEGSGVLHSPDVDLWPVVDDRCVPLEMLRDAKPANKSHVRDFALNAAALDYLPAMVTLGPSCDWLCRLYAANQRRIPWSKIEDNLSVEVRSNHEMVVATNWDINEMEILARGEFNGDGLEDLLVRVRSGAKEGRWGARALFVLTRDAPDGVLWVLDPDTYICDPENYHPCDTHYDQPPALR